MFRHVYVYFVNNFYLMSLWSSVHPRQSECLLRCLGQEGRHEPASHQAHRTDCSLHALQNERQIILHPNTMLTYQGYQWILLLTFRTSWSKADHDVSIALIQLLKSQRGDARPNVQSIAYGSVYIGLLQIWCIIHYPKTLGNNGHSQTNVFFFITVNILSPSIIVMHTWTWHWRLAIWGVEGSGCTPQCLVHHILTASSPPECCRPNSLSPSQAEI